MLLETQYVSKDFFFLVTRTLVEDYKISKISLQHLSVNPFATIFILNK